MITPLRNPGIALILKPGTASFPIDGEKIAALFGELALVFRAAQNRDQRQFCERRYSDDLGRELIYREDHVLGLRVLLFAGPDVLDLHERLAAMLPHYTLEAAFTAAATADDAEQAECEKIATLGPLCALLSYGGHAEAIEHDAYTLLYHRLRDESLAVRRAALSCAAYLVSPEVADILLFAAEDPDLSAEVSRQLSLRAKMAVALDYNVHFEQAEAERAAGRPLSALLAAHIGLALARRTGIRLHEIMALRDALREALPVDLVDDELSLAALQALLDLGRFHEAEEVVTALLQLDEEASRFRLPRRVALIVMLAEALRGRGRYDSAADVLAQELSRLQSQLESEPESPALRSAQKHLEALL